MAAAEGQRLRLAMYGLLDPLGLAVATLGALAVF
jgi:hypothetical protein